MPIDYKKYPPNWKSEIVPRILERAGNCCEMCGLKNRELVYSSKVKGKIVWFRNFNENSTNRPPENKTTPELSKIEIVSAKPGKYVKVVLTIAHLDHDEENWQVKDDRLMAMCQNCHLGYDAKEKQKRILKKKKP